MNIEVNLLVTAVGVLKTLDTTKMKLNTAYKLKQILNSCQDAINDFEGRRIGLAQKYGKLPEGEQFYQFPDDTARESFQSELTELLSQEIDVNIKKIHIDEISDYLEIEPSNIPFIEWFVDGLG